MHLEGGYKAITPVHIANPLAALTAQTISFRSFRVFLGCLELKAIREAANRVRKLKGREGRGQERFEVSELPRLLPDLSERAIRSELRRLSRAKLLSFHGGALEIPKEASADGATLLEALNGSRSSTRPIPIPRRVLRFLCRSRKQALVKTLLAYLVRGLSFERKTGAIRSAGSAKVSWICRVFDLSERAVRAARAELIRLGFISSDETSHQRKLNRHGSYFTVNLEHREESQEEERVIHNGSELSPVVDNSCGSFVRKSAPLQPEKQGEFAPLREILKTLSDLKNQKLAEREWTGFWGREGKPNLRNIRPEDIRKPSRLRELYEQATKAGWLEKSEASALNFTAAAVRANRASGDSVRIFVGIVKKALWHHLSHADEDRARYVALKVR